MSARSRRTVANRPLIALSAAAVVTALLASSPTAAASDQPVASSGGADTDRAEAVLDEARSLFDGKPTKLAPGRDATLVLRDLSLVRSSLQGQERSEADRMLARPAAARSACTATACFHWSETGGDKVSPVDSNGTDDGDGVPDYIEAVAGSVGYVQSTYLAAGYRPVKSDGTRGGNSKPDIYLANIGPDGLYGYCTTDKKRFAKDRYAAWAFCVLDNDYSPAEFPTNTPLENMEVTAAHEYNHAVQFAYDYYLEDAWFMEATATWAEDELYDDVDDNLNYLSNSPLSRPWESLDTFNNGGFQYGTWIFMRYLTEQMPTEEGGMPTLVRDMWRKADGSSPSAPNQYSMQAIASVLKARGTSLADMFAGFADANLRPDVTYSEGAVNGYLPAPSTDVDPGSYVVKLDHMSSSTARTVPQPGNTSLKITVDMPPKATGSAAVVTVSPVSGPVQTSRISLDDQGKGSATYPFDPSSVTSVELTLVNASAKYSCWRRTSFSCQGAPKHDNMQSTLKLVAS